MENPHTDSNRTGARLQRQSILLFILVCCGYSWGLWTLMILSSRGLLPFRFPTNPLGSFGPAVAATAMALAIGGKPQLKRLLAGLGRWRAGGRWYAVALLGMPAVYGVSLTLYRLAGGAVPAPQHLEKWPMVFPLALYILILGGPLGEEIGWRGWLLPELQREQPRFVASLVLALLWFVWHLPLFWLEGAAQQGSSVIFFAVAVLTNSIFFTWVYNNTNGSLLIAVLLHFSINLTSFGLGVALPAALESRLFSVIFTGILILASALLTIGTRFELGRRGVHDEQSMPGVWS